MNLLIKKRKFDGFLFRVKCKVLDDFNRFRLRLFTKRRFFLLPFLFIWGLIWQIQDRKRNPQFYRPHGLYVFTGIYGSGKTISMIKYLQELLEKNPKLEVYSNFDIPFAHSKPLESTEQIESLYNPDGMVFCIDEAQLCFNSRDYQSFPWEMVSAITQNRKEGKVMLFTAQNFKHVDKQIRDLCFRIIECKSILGIYFWNKWYSPDNYDRLDGVPKDFLDPTQKRPMSLRTVRFVGYPELFDSYATLNKIVKLQVKEDFGRRTSRR